MDIFALTNNSINFVLYCTMSRAFRTTFYSIISKYCCCFTRLSERIINACCKKQTKLLSPPATSNKSSQQAKKLQTNVCQKENLLSEINMNEENVCPSVPSKTINSFKNNDKIKRNVSFSSMEMNSIKNSQIN